MNLKFKRLLLLAVIGVGRMAVADVDESTFQELKGFTILDVLTITGYFDENDDDKSDADSNGIHNSFKGCTFGRTIIFEGDRTLKCATYRYHYAYRPKAIILVRDGTFRMIVGDDLYDMMR